MHYKTLPKMLVLGSLLTFVFLSFSASTSSCETSSLSTPTDYKTLAWNDALNAGIPPQYFVNQINAESKFNPNAVSPAGAIGIAQIMPTTALGLGIDPWNPEQSLQGAAALMARYVSKYGDYKMALTAYQCGSGCLQWSIDNCGYWYWCVPASTRQYINEVMS